jgi:uncharacterized protein YfaT (DUF1175 family)
MATIKIFPRFSFSVLIFLCSMTNVEISESKTEKDVGQRTDRIEFARHRLLETALRQATEISGYWDPGQRDCAGLVRFIFREAVAGPAEIWRNRNGKYTAFVSASELVAYNFTKISEVPHLEIKSGSKSEAIETGDLLVFHRPGRRPEDTWHVMVLLKPPTGVRQEWLAIYHNGESGPDGRVRIVSLKDLSSTVHSEWRPAVENLSFKGVYRWNQWIK